MNTDEHRWRHPFPTYLCLSVFICGYNAVAAVVVAVIARPRETTLTEGEAS